MQRTIDNIHYKFIPYSIDENKFNSIIRHSNTMHNDVYEKYTATAEINGELIVCKDPSKMKQRVKKLIREDYQMYLNKLENINPDKDQWIYNIVDGVAEQDKILHRDEKCIVFPSFVWDGNDVNKLHLLCIPVDLNLRTIRSLDHNSLELLQHMKDTTLKVIEDKFNLDKGFIKMFFHYEPSTYHLHIHFTNISNHESNNSSVEYSHELDIVMFNLSIYPDYYKHVLLNVRA
jgi:diadenosine tetraphosphate (Ap4A) HIT family hydrolase